MCFQLIGAPRPQETAPTYDPTLGLRPGTYGGPMGGSASPYERGTPVRPVLLKDSTGISGLEAYCRDTSLLRNCPLPRTSAGPWAWFYCRVLGGGLFLVSEVPL